MADQKTPCMSLKFGDVTFGEMNPTLESMQMSPGKKAPSTSLKRSD
jgi:hypothetical protein